MTFDPWATEQPESTDAFSAVEAVEEKTIVSTSKPPVVVTLKQDGAPPWIVYHGASVDESLALLKESHEKELFKAVSWAQSEFVKSRQGQTPATPQRPAQAPAAQPQQSASNGGDGRTCAHGTMFYKQGTNKFGKPYTAYFCAAEKGTPDQCKAIFV